MVLNLLLSMTTMMAIDHAAHGAGKTQPAPVQAATVPTTTTTPYPDSPLIQDKMLLGEIKKACPIIVNTKHHGDVRLVHDESFQPARKSGEEQVRGGWTVSKGKLVLTWTTTQATESFSIKRASATDFTFSN